MIEQPVEIGRRLPLVGERKYVRPRRQKTICLHKVAGPDVDQNSAVGNLTETEQHCQQNGSTPQHEVASDCLFFNKFGCQFLQLRKVVPGSSPRSAHCELRVIVRRLRK